MATVGRAVKLPALGDIPADCPPQTRELLENLLLTLDIAYGRVGKGTNTRFVTIQDLVNAGVVADGVIK
jgi:hypothetical protein